MRLAQISLIFFRLYNEGTFVSLIKPQKLQKGDTIAIAAPASPFDTLEFENGVKFLKSLGFNVLYREDIFSKKGYLAGSDERRASELMEHLCNPEVKALLFARGGYGCQRIIPLLDEKKIKNHPKIILGYSDISTLLIYLYEKISWVTFHGPVVAKGMGNTFGNRGKESLLRALTQTDPLGKIEDEKIRFIREGNAEAPLIGGCLSLLITNLKSSYELNTDGKILFIEDTNEKPYAIDRMLTQLKLAGKFDKIKGFVFGPFQNSTENEDEIIAVILDVLKGIDVPIAFAFPSGHLEDSMTIPLGVKVKLNSEKQSLEFVEGALRQ